jgi:hypothetical protein
VTIKRAGHGTASAAVEKLLRDEDQTLTLANLRRFSSEVEIQIQALRGHLEKLKAENVRVAGYGAPARVSTICNYGQIGPSLIEFTVDDSPLKQDKFTPGTHIRIVKKEHLDQSRPDVLVVFAYEYLDDIRKKTANAYRYMLPIPPREVN